MKLTMWNDLPFQCKDGYVVKVANTADSDDDFYTQFEDTSMLMVRVLGKK